MEMEKDLKKGVMVGLGIGETVKKKIDEAWGGAIKDGEVDVEEGRKLAGDFFSNIEKQGSEIKKNIE